MNNSKKTAKLYENKTLTLKNNEKEQETAYVANQIENQTEQDEQQQKMQHYLPHGYVRD